MTFQEWFNSAPHRAKYSNDHPAYLAAQEAWEAAHEACAKVCDSLHDNIYLVEKTEHYPGEYGSEYDAGQGNAISECADAIRARGNE